MRAALEELILDIDNNVLEMKARLLAQTLRNISTQEIDEIILAYESLRSKYMAILNKLTEEI